MNTLWNYQSSNTNDCSTLPENRFTSRTHKSRMTGGTQHAMCGKLSDLLNASEARVL